MITRRGLFGILAGAVAAPIVVRSGLLMPVKALTGRVNLDAYRAALDRLAAEMMINPPMIANWHYATAADFYPKPGEVTWADATAFDRFCSAQLQIPDRQWFRPA